MVEVRHCAEAVQYRVADRCDWYLNLFSRPVIMKTPILFACSAVLLASAHLSAQDIPSDTIGDVGWVLFDADTMVMVRAADGNVWLQQNFGAAHVANAFNDAGAFGDLFQWGRWNDQHSSPTSATALASTLAQNNPLGLGIGSDKFYIGPSPADWWGSGNGTDVWGTVASATSGVDPCMALGLGWQLPTQTQWTTVIAAENISNRATAFDSNLKLPAAGARDGQSGIIINAGTYGQYWTSTASGGYAKDLTIGDTWVNPDDDAYRSYGMCVRCLHTSLHLGTPEAEQTLVPRIYPNPSSGTVVVDLGQELIRSIAVHASDQRLVHMLTVGAPSTTLSLDGLPAGLYWLTVETAHGSSWHRFLLER